MSAVSQGSGEGTMGQKTETAGAPKNIFGLCLFHGSVRWSPSVVFQEVSMQALPYPVAPTPTPCPSPAGMLRCAPLDLWAASLQVRAGVGHGAVRPRTLWHLCP